MSSIEISIRKPCSQNWDDFEKHDGRGYCTLCEKHVIDFTTYSDRETVDFFTNLKGKTCGKFRRDQLKSYPIDSKPKGFNRIFAFITAGVVVLTQAPEANAQKIRTEQVSRQGDSETSDQVVSTRRKIAFVVSGRVLDEDKIPVPWANIVVKGSTVGTTTDENGIFRMVCTARPNDDITLIISFIGYTTVERTVNTEESFVYIGSIVLEADTTVLSAPDILIRHSGLRGFFYRLTHPFRRHY